MACKRSGVQIPSAPHRCMKTFFLETKELILSQGIIAVLAIIQIRIVAKAFGPELYGTIGVYLGLIAICFRVLNSRNSDLILINFKNTKKNFLKTSILFEFFLGLLSSVLIIVLLLISKNFDLLNLYNLPSYLVFYIFSRIFLNVMEVFKGIYTHQGDMKTYSSLEAFSNILRFSLVVSFVIYESSLESFFNALSIHALIVGILVLYLLSKNNEQILDSMGIVEYFQLSKKSFYQIRSDQAVGLIPAHLDIVVIGYFANFYAAGIYRIAKKLVDPINYLIVAFSPWMLNKISNDSNFKFSSLVKRIILPASITLFTLYFIFGNLLIDLIVGEDFADSFYPMLILLVGYISYFLTFWTRHYLFLNDLIIKHTYGRLINLSVFIILTAVLANTFSYNGIALALTLGTITQKMYELFTYLRHKNSKSKL